MARRKKEAPEIHREKIAQAAARLFASKGVEAATMDDVAREAGYSKATLYVYYKNKEELVGVLALESMKKLCDSIRESLETGQGNREKYNGLCWGLVRYQREFPFYFKTALTEIDLDNGWAGRESFRVGEEINRLLLGFIREGVQAGEFRAGTGALPTVFSFWGMLSGLILTAAQKEKYIGGELGLSREAFLQLGFDTLYRALEKPVERRDLNE